LRLNAFFVAVGRVLLSNLRFTIPKLKLRVDICVRTLSIPAMIVAQWFATQQEKLSARQWKFIAGLARAIGISLWSLSLLRASGSWSQSRKAETCSAIS